MVRGTVICSIGQWQVKITNISPCFYRSSKSEKENRSIMTSICILVSVSFSKLIREENMLVWVRDSHIMRAPILKNQPSFSWSNPKTKFTRSTHNLANWRNPKTHKKTHNDPQENPSTIACYRDRSSTQVDNMKGPRHTGDFNR